MAVLKLHIASWINLRPSQRCASMEIRRGSIGARRVRSTRTEAERNMAAWFEGIGDIAAACTTFCWLPQAVKILREKRTEGISLITQSVFTFGIAMWAAYGLLLNNRPIIYANVVTLFFSLAILILKLRYHSAQEK